MAIDLLRYYLQVNRDLDFDPPTEVEVFVDPDPSDPDVDGEFRTLSNTEFSVESVVEAADNNELGGNRVRIPETTPADYLDYMSTGVIDDSLHDDPALDREQLVNLADAGYTTGEDLSRQGVDLFELERETRIDRDVLQKVAAQHMAGFTTAGDIQDGGSLGELQPRDDFDGWDLRDQRQRNRIVWTTDGNYRITLKHHPDLGTAITTNTPNYDRHEYIRLGWHVDTPDSGGARIADPSTALDQVHEWLTAHQFQFEDDLTKLTHIGRARRDYLALAFDVTSFEELKKLTTAEPDVFEDIFGEYAKEVAGEVTTRTADN